MATGEEAEMRKILCRKGRRWLLAAAALLAAGCYSVPETGRQALMVLPESQMVAMGAEAFREIKQHEKPSRNQAARQRVARVGRRIAAVSRAATGIKPERWELATFASEEKNAFALPGGKVGVYEGILEVAATDAELATVMGHEVAHVAARHGGERMSEMLLVSMGGMALSAALREEPQQTRQLYLLAYGVGTQLGRILPHSRRQELEADQIGLLYMARAGYDPRAAVSFWKKMEKAGGGKQAPVFLSTHPSHGQRIERLQRWMPKALREYRKSRRPEEGRPAGSPERAGALTEKGGGAMLLSGS